MCIMAFSDDLEYWMIHEVKKAELQDHMLSIDNQPTTLQSIGDMIKDIIGLSRVLLPKQVQYQKRVCYRGDEEGGGHLFAFRIIYLGQL